MRGFTEGSISLDFDPLALLVDELHHLDLTDDVQATKHMVDGGGFSDIAQGYSRRHSKKVAIKSLRTHLKENEMYAKVMTIVKLHRVAH